MIAFIARDESPHLSDIANKYDHEKEYLYGSLFIWKVFIDQLNKDEINELIREVTRVEEFVDINMENTGDIMIDGGWIKSSLNLYVEDDDNTDVDAFKVISVHEERLLKEITEAYDINVDSNRFKSDQNMDNNYDSPRDMASKILIEVSNNTFDADIDTSSLFDDFTVAINCDESNVTGGSMCVVTVYLNDENVSISRYYHNLKDVVQLLIDTKQLVTQWALFYYSMTNRLSIASLPAIVEQ